MTGKDLWNAMNYVEDELVENCKQQSTNGQVYTTEATALRSRKSGFTKAVIKWVAVAAAVLVFLGGSVAYAAKYGLLRKDIGKESGYLFSVTSRQVTEEEFSEEIRAVKQELQKDIAASENEKNTPFFGWMQEFDSVADTVSFIDFAGMKVPEYPGTLTRASVVVTGNPQAEILMVEASAHYNLDKMMLTGDAMVYTTFITEELLVGTTVDDKIFTQENYITANGREAVIMVSVQPQPDKFSRMHGYLVDDSVIYNLYISYLEEDETKAMQVMKEWLDQF